jgi:PAS domain S-box-containing protein
MLSLYPKFNVTRTEDGSGMKPDSAKNTGPLINKVVLLDARQREFVLSPLRLMFTLLMSVFIIETLVMVVLEYQEPVGWKETLIDSSILVVSLFVILYYTMFKPLVVLIDDFKLKELKLNNRQEHLEQVIDECARSEAALYETKAILQAAMDQSPTGIAIADAPDGVLRYVNNAGLFIRGGDRETLVEGIGIDQYVASWKILDFDGNPLKTNEIPLTRAIRFGETCSRELIIRRAEDDERIVLVNAAPIRNDTGEVVAGIAVFWDITERKVVEEELKGYQNHLEKMIQERSRDLEETSRRLKQENEEHIQAKKKLLESEEHFRQIFYQSEDAIVLISPEDNAIIDVNPTAERVFQKQRMELLAGGLPALCDTQECNYLVSVLDQIIHENSSGMIEKFKCILPPGETHILSFHGKKIHLQGSEVIYTTFRDITARIRLEEQALEIQSRLIQANRMTSLGTMVSSVAHEINNPNNFLLMNAGIIKQAWDDIAPVIEEHFRSNGDFAVAQSTWSEARSFLPDAIDGIQQGALRISNIVGNLKAYGREERFEPESVADVNSVVQLSVSILSHLISSSTHRFKLELVEGLPLVRGSARQLEQVVINLIQNALLALPDQGHGVSVSTGICPESGHVLIRISDEGVGIAPDIASRIMEPFFTTRLELGGTGLGLAICSTIVKEHGGSIEFSSEPGVGTTFTVRLCRAVSSENTLVSEENNVYN